LNLTKAVTALKPIAAMVRRIGNPYDGPMTSPTTERIPAPDVLRGVAVADSLLGVIMEAIGHPMLALGYAATVALLVVDFGPVEWIWRRLTYRRPLPLRA
jgi:uncharacterized membrane protein YeiB